MSKDLAVEIEQTAEKVSEAFFDFPSLTLEEKWGESKRMPKRRKSNYKMPEKTYWHIYSLQTLNSEKFVKVVNKILKREYILIK